MLHPTMSRKRELECKLCDESTVFENIDEVEDSEWTEVSPMGMMRGSGDMYHPAFCPGHSIETDTEGV